MGVIEIFACWKASFPIPPDILDCAGSPPGDLGGCEATGDIDFTRLREFPTIPVLVVDGFCDWHTDDQDDHYSALLVIRNYGGCWVEVEGEPIIRDQPVGTIIALDIHKNHRLANPKGDKPPSSTYMVVVLDSTAPLSRNDWELRFKEKLK